jgi:RNA polymerase sigma factor for flagellar operon FliA
VAATRSDLEALRARLPGRAVRRFVGEEALDDLAVGASTTESAVAAREGAAIVARTRVALIRALAGLSPQDQLVLRLHFGEGLTIADVARALRVEQKPLYRQLERALETLRHSLESQGIRGEAVVEWLGRAEWEEEGSGNVLAGPSL